MASSGEMERSLAAHFIHHTFPVIRDLVALMPENDNIAVAALSS
jgi:hypothetical protein